MEFESESSPEDPNEAHVGEFPGEVSEYGACKLKSLCTQSGRAYRAQLNKSGENGQNCGRGRLEDPHLAGLRGHPEAKTEPT